MLYHIRVWDCQVCSSHVALTHTHTHTHTHTPCFLSLLKEFQPSLLSSWEHSSFPFFSFLSCPFLVLSPRFLSFPSVSAEFTAGQVRVHTFHWRFDGQCSRSHQNKFFPYLLLFSSSRSILVGVGRALLSSMMDHFSDKLNIVVPSCQKQKEHYILMTGSGQTDRLSVR